MKWTEADWVKLNELAGKLASLTTREMRMESGMGPTWYGIVARTIEEIEKVSGFDDDKARLEFLLAGLTRSATASGWIGNTSTWQCD